jgi:hypothetical protein
MWPSRRTYTGRVAGSWASIDAPQAAGNPKDGGKGGVAHHVVADIVKDGLEKDSI